MTPRMPVAKWVLVSLFAALCLISLAQGLWIVKKGSDSLSWSATEGTIGLSRVETRTFRHRVTEPYKRYYPDLLYTYEVQGQQHTGMQIYATPSFMIFGYAIGENPGSTQIESVEATLARYPVGQKVMVYYDPDNPAVSVLEPGTPPGTAQYFAWAVVGVAGMFLTLLFTEPELITRIWYSLTGQPA